MTQNYKPAYPPEFRQQMTYWQRLRPGCKQQGLMGKVYQLIQANQD
ncbi:MAG: hypothetical protein IPO71_14355 [Nitrosomonas sp.]|nr:hypothetical protein [Nitrosomonas sp.]